MVLGDSKQEHAFVIQNLRSLFSRSRRNAQDAQALSRDAMDPYDDVRFAEDVFVDHEPNLRWKW